MRRMRKHLALASLALVLAAGGCDSAQQVAGPEMKAQFAKKAGPERVTATVTPGSNFADVGPNGEVIAVVSGGKTLAILEIPAGTVKKDTRFTIDVSDDFMIELTATSARSSRTNDVGSAGFKKGLTLYINAAAAAELSIATGIAELKSNGSLVPVESSKDGAWLVGTLRHFSAYVPVSGYVPISD